MGFEGLWKSQYFSLAIALFLSLACVSASASQVVMCWVPVWGDHKDRQQILMVARFEEDKVSDPEAQGLVGTLEVTNSSSYSGGGVFSNKMQLFMNSRRQRKFEFYEITMEALNSYGAYRLYMPARFVGRTEVRFQSPIEFSDTNSTEPRKEEMAECVSLLF